MMNKSDCLKNIIARINDVEPDSIEGDTVCDLLNQIMEMIESGKIDVDIVPITDAEIDAAWALS